MTHRSVQAKFATSLTVWFIFFLLSFIFVFFTNYAISSEKTELMLVHDQLLTKSLLLQQSKNLLLLYGLAACVFFVLMWFYIVIYSHRLTGPIYKLTRILEKAIETGELPHKVSFRKSDAFKELAHTFNVFIEKVDKMKHRHHK